MDIIKFVSEHPIFTISVGLCTISSFLLTIFTIRRKNLNITNKQKIKGDGNTQISGNGNHFNQKSYRIINYQQINGKNNIQAGGTIDE